MVKKAVSVKITRPRLSGVVGRSRLFGVLDAAMKKPVIWLSSPAGSGKTTLVSSYLDSHGSPCIWYQCDEGDSDPATFFYYMGLAAGNAAPRRKGPLPLLTPEYLPGINTFARRYFEALYNRIAGLPGGRSPRASRGAGQGFFIVLDNYQDLPADSPFHDIIAVGLSTITDGIRVIIVSRSDPPRQMARLNAGGRISLVGYDKLRFTFTESKKLVTGHIPGLDDGSIRTMHENTEGWAAGIILMLEKTRLEGGVALSSPDIGYDRVFDYFAGEIFDKADSGVQDFLLKTVFLPTLSVPLAERLTKTGHAGQILSMLNRHNYFTERLSGDGQGYRFHPLFKEFLLNRSKVRHTPDEIAAIRKEAALLMEELGQTENAARLYLDASEGQYLARMVIRHAREFLRQGRNRTVAEWIAGIPDEMAAGNPWLLYWKAMCSFPFDVPFARDVFEKALAAFKAADDAAGQYLCWARIVDTYSFELDEWKRFDDCFAVFEELRREYPSFPTKEIDLVASSRMLTALILRRTDKPREILRSIGRVMELIQADPSPEDHLDTIFFISVYHLWKGDYHKNAVLLDDAQALVLHQKASPLAVVCINLMKGIHHWVTAGYGPALETLSEGLRVSGESGVHIFDSLLWSFRAAAEMAAGNLESAAVSLQNQMKTAFAVGRSLDIFFYHINAAWLAVLRKDPSLAIENLQAVTAKVDRMGNPYYQALWHIGMAQARFLAGNTADAGTHVSMAHRIGEKMKSQVIEWYSLLVEAYFLFREGSDRKGLPLLRRALELGRKNGYAHLEFYQPDLMSILCAKALEHGLEPEYVKGLIRRLRLAPPVAFGNPTLSTEDWPYPLKVCTLGRFEILKNDEAVVFSGKVRKKPLEMLKAVIAFGGTNVSAERVMDALWPDTEGDLARKSFEVTLSRLRQLFGPGNQIRYSGGQLSIDPLFCRVDSLVLENVLERIRSSGQREAAVLCETAIGLYRGPFLPSDTGLAFTAHKREILKNGLLRAIVTTGRSLEEAGQWEKALEHYRKGVEIDQLAEVFYQRLMVCHHHLGNNAEAAKTYRRCREVLGENLGVRPSGQTEMLYASMLQEQ
ncbi:MAG: HTH-type transcriptional regulator MalT [Syntrophorhabdus sp. PtaB.Bin184]|jgi:LuxR family maltose regulon positive regulatory protein|nr:MAG: HTH-type transcriptional regulator MalT [Syntrophorhabdus sp. PtaB.Bin184]